MNKVYTLDTTLRDGMQSAKISFTIEDKIKIIKYLDRLGIDYIEAGNPYSNIKDAELFERLAGIKLKHSRIASFGSTRKVGVTAEKDPGLRVLKECSAETAVIFGKAWKLHINEILGTTPEDNLAIIRESIEYLCKNGKKVIFDAEHFFDGYKADKEYAIHVIRTAHEAGAEYVVLCDTNGGSFPAEIYEIVSEITKETDVPIGIHTHDDSGMAVACGIAAVQAGAVHIQGTINGVGERCGNANLATMIANLQLKKGYRLIPEESMPTLTEIARAIAEISNISTTGLPYISKSAFSHKAGMHIDAVMKNPASFEHIDPECVGNSRNILLSEMSGKAAILPAINKVVPGTKKDSPIVDMILRRLKELEFKGYQFEAANASLDLVIRKTLGIYRPFFELVKFKVFGEYDNSESSASAIVKIMVGSREELTAADSTEGPVHAIDTALRKALYVFYPELRETKLTDYKVRVLNSSDTRSMVRVLIDTRDNNDTWSSVGISADIIEASKNALMESLEYKLIKTRG